MSQFTATDEHPYTDHPGTAGPRPDEEPAHDKTTPDKFGTEPAGAREDTAADEYAAPVAAIQPAGTARLAETGGAASNGDTTSQPPVAVPALVMQAGPAQADAAAAARSTEAGGAHHVDGADLERRWQLVQASFVDEPRQAVEDADALVVETVRTINDALEGKRSRLEDAWNGSGGSDTEQLLVALRGYRDLFRHLLTV
jgi:hypothetical protein